MFRGRPVPLPLNEYFWYFQHRILFWIFYTPITNFLEKFWYPKVWYLKNLHMFKFSFFEDYLQFMDQVSMGEVLVPSIGMRLNLANGIMKWTCYCSITKFAFGLMTFGWENLFSSLQNHSTKIWKVARNKYILVSVKIIFWTFISPFQIKFQVQT